MEFMKLASERYSVRNFSDERISDGEIEKILLAGHIAPTGCNYQPQRILVIKSDEAKEKLKNCTKCHFGCDIAFLVCYNKDECWRRKYDGKSCGVSDACIVATHMMLQAYEMGIGSTWVMHFNPFAVKESFNIPDNIEPVALLVMGYPAQDAKPLDLHFKQRPMEETVVYDNF